MTNVHEAQGLNEGQQFSFGGNLLPEQTLITSEFAIKFIKKTREKRWPFHNFKLYVIHPTFTEVHFTREGMVFPANDVGEQEGLKISRINGLNQVGRVYIGDADLDFKKLFPGDEGQNLDFTITSPGFIGHTYDRGDASISKLMEAYIQSAKSGL